MHLAPPVSVPMPPKEANSEVTNGKAEIHVAITAR